VRGDGPRAVPIPQRESLAQHRLHQGGQWGARMILSEEATPAQQMRETRLMARPRKVAIGGPAVTHQRAGIVCAQPSRGLREAAPGRTTGRRIGRSSWY
jgi:hypothetical protein